MKTKKKSKQGDIVLITWLDAFGLGSWNTMNDVDDGLKNHITCEIVGYYIKEDKNFIALSMGIQDDINSSPFLHLEFIPKGSVVDLRVIRLSELENK